MQKILKLIRKDFIVDWRQQNPITGILLYLISTIFASYMAFKGFVSMEVWNALYWIILIFTAINAISKSFIQEEKRTLYYFFLSSPSLIITAKLIYSFLYLLTLGIAALLVFSIFFGSEVTNWTLFISNLVIGCLGLSSAFTMVSAIAFNASNRAIMMAVLGFPVIIPVLVLAIRNSYRILDGEIWMQIQGNMLTLISVDVIIIALAFVLFPFTWRS